MLQKLQHFSTKPGTEKIEFYDIKPNEQNRDVFFSTMIDTDKVHWTHINLYRAFWLSNLYVEYVNVGLATRIISMMNFAENLIQYYDKIKPVINFEQRSNYVLYKALPKEVGLDLLCFLQLENFIYKLKIHNMNTHILVNETLLKIILKDYGMDNMPDPVIDIGMKGYDSLHRRQYNPLEVAKAVIITQSVASENLRHHELVEASKIKENKDLSRLFPSQLRRFESTDRV